MSEGNLYDSSSIQILKGLDPVRKRPGMYIGDTSDGSGLHHMVFEVVDNSIDEVLAGFATHIWVTMHADGAVTVRDDGRGIPIDIHPEEGRSAVEVIMTVLHAGGKFDQDAYQISGGLHGVGVSVVNALSEELVVTIQKDGQLYRQTYKMGVPQAPLTVIGSADSTGTEIRFKPCPKVFGESELSYGILEKRLRELSFLNAGARIELRDERSGQHDFFEYQGGVQAFVEYLNKNHQLLVNTKIFYFQVSKNNITIELAIQWNGGFQENICCFTNNIPQRDGGTHLSGFRSGLTRIIHQYMHELNLLKKDKLAITGEDCREGLTAVLSIKLADPKFSSQTKDKLVSSEVRPVVESSVIEKFNEYLLENPKEARSITEKILKAANVREAAQKAREINRRSNAPEINSSLIGKFKDCRGKIPEKREIFLLEGQSAAGSAASARDSLSQAILALKGKILNIEKVAFSKMLTSEEIGTLIMVLGCGVGQDYDPDKLRYHRIIIMTDADVDGAHIRTLLLTFFYRQMPELIERGHIYIAQPPLYKLKKHKREQYVKDDPALEALLLAWALEGARLYPSETSPPMSEGQLADLTDQFRLTMRSLARLGRRYLMDIVRELQYLPPLLTEELSQREKVKVWVDCLIEHLQKQSSQLDIRYRVEMHHDEEHQIFLPVVHVLKYGVENTYYFNQSFFASADYKQIITLYQKLSGVIQPGAYVERSDKRLSIHHFGEALEWLMQEAKRGVNIQRYKGLGEMNPDQLRETTMDPQKRRLLHVKIEDVPRADEMFTTLMGDQVEPRREFIEKNALSVENLDI